MRHLQHLASLLALAAPSLGSAVQVESGSLESVLRKPQLADIWPSPQEISAGTGGVRLNGDVTIVTSGNSTDKPTLKVVKDLVAAVGGKVSVSSKRSGHGTNILIGTSEEGGAAAKAAEALTGKSAEGLDADGYVLAAGKYEKNPSIVLNGVDDRGTFYAAQTLRQLAQDSKVVPDVQVRDWPLMPVRGSIEGFYGIPWSHQARLDQLVFYGEHKINTYIYTPKDDELLRKNWRELYKGADLDKLQELIDTANANHVDFTFALSPGNDLCYTSEDDFDALIAKFDQIRKLGVSRFYIALDDIPTDKFHCDSDTKKWPLTDDFQWLAAGQAYFLNRVQEEYIQASSGKLEDLETVPTNYTGSEPAPYKHRFGTDLNKNVRVQWTGEGVFSPNVTVESVSKASESYVTKNLFFWDNFPVNDGNFSRVFLNPLTERDPDLYKHLLGFTSNPMQQPYASMLALTNYADYTWNGPAYDATTSTAHALWELSGSDKKVHEALAAFVDLNQDWPYRTPEVFAPMLNKDIEAFWKSRNSSASGDGTEPLHKRLNLISKLPQLLSDMEVQGFAADVKPWSTAAMQWATACKHLISMLDAIKTGDKAAAGKQYKKAQEWVEKTKDKTVETLDRDGNPDYVVALVGDGAFRDFVRDATILYKSQ